VGISGSRPIIDHLMLHPVSDLLHPVSDLLHAMPQALQGLPLRHLSLDHKAPSEFFLRGLRSHLPAVTYY
jgi:hypothetical protein